MVGLIWLCGCVAHPMPSIKWDIIERMTVGNIETWDQNDRDTALNRMNMVMQTVYEATSENNAHPGNGRDGLDRLKRIFFRSGGSKTFWRQALIYRNDGPKPYRGAANDENYPANIPKDYR